MNRFLVIACMLPLVAGCLSPADSTEISSNGSGNSLPMASAAANGCSVTSTAGGATISCSDGSSASISNGSQGAQGLNGLAGVVGATGASGASGASGNTGPTGVAGTTSGTGGTGGPTGAIGASGASGASGSTGPTGPAGASATGLKVYDALGGVIGGTGTTLLGFDVDFTFVIWNSPENSLAIYGNTNLQSDDLYYTTGSCTGTAYSTRLGNRVFKNNGSIYKAAASAVSITAGSKLDTGGLCTTVSWSTLAYVVSTYSGSFADNYTPPFSIKP